MALQSKIPEDITPARRLHEYLELVRELSLSREPNALINSFRKRAGFVIPADHRLSVSRRGLPDDAIRVTRSTRWEEDIDPWKQPERLPVLRRGLLWELAHAGAPVKIDRLELDPDDPSCEHLEGMGSLLSSPLFEDGEPVYTVFILRREPNSFTLDELANFVLTGNLVGRATSNLKLAEELREAYHTLDREFHVVGQIQRGLLPQKLPDIPRVTIATQYETSTRAGGDYYDFFAFPDGKWLVMIADVSGHGPGAAVVMAMTRTLLRALHHQADRHAPAPADVLQHLNRGLMDSVNPGQFATAFVVLLDPARRTVRYASAGHNPPRWLHGSEQRIVPLDSAAGLPLAIVEDYTASEHEIAVSQGDRLLLYTDGITETTDADDRMFGTDGLDAALHCCSRTAAGLIDAIDEAVRAHAGSEPIVDDRTLLALAFH